MLLAAAYAALVASMSVVAFIAYGLDKRRAVNGARRLPERRLHLFALLGGWPGALAGQRYFRHKTQKLGFRLVLWLVVALHLLLIGAAVYWMTR